VLPAVNWWQKRRINRRYGELKFLEADIASRTLSPQEIAQAHRQLDHIAQEVAGTRFPLDFADRVYTLRQHVNFVRSSLARPADLSCAPPTDQLCGE
jgi:hypothetical protein